MTAIPTVILVHGAFADASGFAGIIRELQSQGLEVRAPMNPLRGLAFDADAIARYAKSIEGPILLAGHSYGGAVITQAATAIKTATALVYLSDVCPRRERELCQSAGTDSHRRCWHRRRFPARTTRPEPPADRTSSSRSRTSSGPFAPTSVTTWLRRWR